jgi:6-pyruvoyltetrahydropterin/6-carboxytetrahydropterin synthase
MNSVCKELCFDAAHRLHQYQGKCSQIHGHRYRVVVELGYTEVNEVGIGVDFRMIKETVGKWIDENWDHKLILNWDDPLYHALRDFGGVDEGEMFLMRGNPTAENMAEFIAKEVIDVTACCRPRAPNWGVLSKCLISVEVYETPTSSAKYVVKR